MTGSRSFRVDPQLPDDRLPFHGISLLQVTSSSGISRFARKDLEPPENQRPVPTRHCFVPKSGGEAGLELADFRRDRVAASPLSSRQNGFCNDWLSFTSSRCQARIPSTLAKWVAHVKAEEAWVHGFRAEGRVTRRRVAPQLTPFDDIDAAVALPVCDVEGGHARAVAPRLT